MNCNSIRCRFHDQINIHSADWWYSENGLWWLPRKYDFSTSFHPSQMTDAMSMTVIDLVCGHSSRAMNPRNPITPNLHEMRENFTFVAGEWLRNTLTATQFDFAQTEIGQFQMAGGRQQHVIGFDVTMNDTMFMEIFQCHCYLGAIESGGRFVKIARHCEQRFHIAANHVLHNLKIVQRRQQLNSRIRLRWMQRSFFLPNKWTTPIAVNRTNAHNMDWSTMPAHFVPLSPAISYFCWPFRTFAFSVRSEENEKNWTLATRALRVCQLPWSRTIYLHRSFWSPNTLCRSRHDLSFWWWKNLGCSAPVRNEMKTPINWIRLD